MKFFQRDDSAEKPPFPEDVSSSNFEWLQGWYMAQCNGIWEHAYGVSIDTLDNPGWTVKIELTGTDLAGRAFDSIVQHRDEHDWVTAQIESEVFTAMCGPLNLGEALFVFRRWVQSG